ncbi:hypothetical protein BVG16_28260 [Paenibacillus selenitireducens]|uniref:DUF2306 domain-containing protein n=1 Tax=Paenibacillus selenitireducens TaxID=1324314 RepID=A0A1T2X148_9BACL|nr:DUF2306 domain-containing protein [Paenibacillus selenitireducens]OPA73525.1 hypothetical protein BVG16_28260 [Paenibacillus selenitireducens]
MKIKKHLYPIMIIVSVLYILYVTYMNLFYDPQATSFLRHKINLQRPLHIPIWLNVMYIHVIFACLAMLAGAINFSKHTQRKFRKFHRMNGYLYVISVCMVDITSGYMAPFSTAGKINSIAFNAVNMIWLAMTIMALVYIKRKQPVKHRHWMVRSYAFCFTNLFIHLFTFILHNGTGLPYELSYTIGVYGAIFTNLVLAEIVIRYIMTNAVNQQEESTA